MWRLGSRSWMIWGGQEPLDQLGGQLRVTVGPIEKPCVLIRSEEALLWVLPQFFQSPQGHGSVNLGFSEMAPFHT